MNVRTVIGGLIGVAGAAALGNHVLSIRSGEPENPLTGVERTYRWRGMDVRYTVTGEPTDPDLLLLHGIYAGASSGEFEGIVDDLSENFRVIAVDLPGFGRSDRPPIVYSATVFEEFVRDFAEEVTDEPIVVASSLTGSYAVAAARACHFDRLVLICPTDETVLARPWLRTLVRMPLVGTTLFNLLASKPSIRFFLGREGHYDASAVDETQVEYAWRTAHQPGARYALASFVAGTLDPPWDLSIELASLDVPVTLLWGRNADRIPLQDGRTLAETADTDLVVVDYSTQLPHVEHPEIVVDYFESDLRRLTH